jgi:hypothetical protein
LSFGGLVWALRDFGSKLLERGGFIRREILVEPAFWFCGILGRQWFGFTTRGRSRQQDRQDYQKQAVVRRPSHGYLRQDGG